MATRYHALISNLPDTIVAVYDRELRGVSIDGPALAQAGFDRESFVGRTLDEYLPPQDAGRLEPLYRAALRGESHSAEYRHSDSNRVYQLEVVPYRQAAEEPICGVFTIARDMTAAHRAAEEARKRTEQQAAVAALGVAALEGLRLTDLMDRAVSIVAQTLEVEFCELLELTEERESMLLRAGTGWRPGLVRSALVPAGSAYHAGFTWGTRGPVVVEDYASERRFGPTHLLRDHQVRSGVSVILGAKRRPFGILGAHSSAPRSFQPYELDFVQAVANVLAEAIARELAEQRVRHQAFHDPLTGLPNRTLLLERLGHWFERAERARTTGALLFIDLDHFKMVNDRHGHGVGDQLICAVADRLAGVVRASDTVARVGGDEFLVLCEDIGEERQAFEMAERLLSCLKDPFAIAGQQLQTTASIGLALTDGGGQADPLIRDADAAMYRAKERGGARFEVFDEAMREWSQHWRDAEDDIRRGLAEGEFHNVYQPIVEPSDGRVLGFEALVRWSHPERGVVSPAEFIPAAEHCGLIVELGGSVLLDACHEAAGWPASADGDAPRVSVNLSPRQLAHAALVETVQAALTESGLAPERLSLELTESALIDDADGAVERLAELKALGVRLELDDFGTGYSSLTYARQLPIDALKIDRSFVDGLGRNPEDSAIVSAVLSMGRALGLHVVAEGVETEEQVRHLRMMGCRLAQGYLFSKPLSAQDARALTDAAAFAPATAGARRASA